MSPLAVNLFQQRLTGTINKADPTEVDIEFFRWGSSAQFTPAVLERGDGFSGQAALDGEENLTALLLSAYSKHVVVRTRLR